jgi:hypothetical protein
MTAQPPFELTLARVRGVLAFGKGGIARESNVTDVKGGLVYWETRAWLERNGYVEHAGHANYRLTEAGKRLRAQIVAKP